MSKENYLGVSELIKNGLGAILLIQAICTWYLFIQAFFLPYHDNIDNISDAIFLSAMPVPMILLAACFRKNLLKENRKILKLWLVVASPVTYFLLVLAYVIVAILLGLMQ